MSVGPSLQQAREALDLVLKDIVAEGWKPRVANVRIDEAWSGGADPNPDPVVSYGGHEFTVESDLPFAEQVVHIAYMIQDDVVDDIQRGWPLSRDGRRLLSPRTRPSDGTAWWYDEEEPIVPIGVAQRS